MISILAGISILVLGCGDVITVPNFSSPKCRFWVLFLRESPSFGPTKCQFRPAEKPEIGKLLLFCHFYKHRSGPTSLVCLISLASSLFCYPVDTASASIRRTMAANKRLVRRLSASAVADRQRTEE